MNIEQFFRFKDLKMLDLFSKIIPICTLILYAISLIGNIFFYQYFFDINIIYYFSLTELLLDAIIYIVPILLIEIFVLSLLMSLFSIFNKQLTILKYLVITFIIYFIGFFISMFFHSSYIVYIYLSSYTLLLTYSRIILGSIYLYRSTKNRGIKGLLLFAAIIVFSYLYVIGVGLSKTAIKDYNSKNKEYTIVMEDGKEYLLSPNTNMHLIGETNSAYFIYDERSEDSITHKRNLQGIIIKKERVKEFRINYDTIFK